MIWRGPVGRVSSPPASGPVAATPAKTSAAIANRAAGSRGRSASNTAAQATKVTSSMSGPRCVAVHGAGHGRSEAPDGFPRDARAPDTSLSVRDGLTPACPRGQPSTRRASWQSPAWRRHAPAKTWRCVPNWCWWPEESRRRRERPRARRDRPGSTSRMVGSAAPTLGSSAGGLATSSRPAPTPDWMTSPVMNAPSPAGGRYGRVAEICSDV